MVHFELLDLMHKQGKPAEDYSMEPLSEEAPFSQKMLSKVYTIVPMLWRCDFPEGRPVKPPVRLTSWPALSKQKNPNLLWRHALRISLRFPRPRLACLMVSWSFVTKAAVSCCGNQTWKLGPVWATAGEHMRLSACSTMQPA